MSVSVGLVEQLIEKAVPKAWAEDWDNPGLLTGSGSRQVSKILLALDGTPEVAAGAARAGAELVVTHHPLMFRPLKNIRQDNPAAHIPLLFWEKGISCLAAHTNLDQSRFSSSLIFSRLLGLQKSDYFAVTGAERLLKLVVYVPEEQAEKVRDALAAAGAGQGVTSGEHSDDYADCFFQVTGTGMFRPLSGANPAIGNIGELTKVQEARLETVVTERKLPLAIQAMYKTHPYEEPAFDILPLDNKGQKRGYGALGYLPESKPLPEVWAEFIAKLKAGMDGSIFPKEYDMTEVRLVGDLQRNIRKIAILNGSGNSFSDKAVFQGADLYITGELDYHHILDCLAQGTAVGLLGHFLSEIPMLVGLGAYLREQKELACVEINLF